MPAVTLFSNPKGDPIATTHSPTRARSGLPIFTVGRFVASMRSTATSVCLSWPITLALNSRLSVSFTITSSASAMTCALVRTMPSGLTMKPEPRPCVGIRSPRPGWPGMPKPRKKSKKGESGSMSYKSAAVLFMVPETLILTTAGPCTAAIALKSGRLIPVRGASGAEMTDSPIAVAARAPPMPRWSCKPYPPANAAPIASDRTIRLWLVFISLLVFLPVGRKMA